MDVEDLNRGDYISATFNPKKIDTLKESVKSVIGKTFLFQYLWPIEDADSSVYNSQIAWGFPTELTEQILATWCPTEDLDDIHVVHEIWTEKGKPVASTNQPIELATSFTGTKHV